FVVQAVLDISAHHGGCGLGPKRQGLVIAVFEGIHLLHHDVGILAHTAREKGGLLENWSANLPEIVGRKDSTGRVLDMLPKRRLRRQQITGTLDGANRLDISRHDEWEARFTFCYAQRDRLPCTRGSGWRAYR